MATEKQIQANRNNAKKSTGPRTEEGKARVSQNAIKHGLLAGEAILAGEDPAEFKAVLAALEEDIQPSGAVEYELVRQIAAAQWRLLRLSRLEAGYFAAALDNARRVEYGPKAEERQFSYREDTLLLGSALRRDSQALAHFARYDAHLSGRFERARRQIAWLRDAREKRCKQAGKGVRYEPAARPNPPSPRPYPANGATITPADGPASAVTDSGFPQNYETDPISSNHHGINEIGEPRSPVLVDDCGLDEALRPRTGRLCPSDVCEREVRAPNGQENQPSLDGLA